MAFTRVHYKELARIIAEVSELSKSETGSAYTIDKAHLIDELSTFFKRDNSRFQESLFIDACYSTS